MKRLFLSTAAAALLFTTACTTVNEDTDVNATDTVEMLPPADNTGPGIDGASPDMVEPGTIDVDAQGAYQGSGGASNTGSGSEGGNSGATNSANNNSNRGGAATNTRTPREVVVPAAPPAKDPVRSTYKRAAPGDTVDSRTPIGSSR